MWIEQILNAGFAPMLPNKNGTNSIRAYDFKHNWLGCSTYEPDQVLMKGDKKIILSLQGIYTGQPTSDEYNKFKSLWKEMKIRYIAFTENKKILWKTWSGELPPDELVDKFCS